MKRNDIALCDNRCVDEGGGSINWEALSPMPLGGHVVFRCFAKPQWVEIDTWGPWGQASK